MRPFTRHAPEHIIGNDLHPHQPVGAVHVGAPAEREDVTGMGAERDVDVEQQEMVGITNEV
jgi:hypothetical protein